MWHDLAKQVDLPTLIQRLWDDISAIAPDRFKTYCLERDTSKLDALARHAWNTALCESLQPSLHAAELTLRNEIHRSLSDEYEPDWMNRDTLLLNEEYQRVQEARDKIRDARKPVTPDRVVSRLGFGFWVALLNSPYEDSVVHPVLARSFKGLPSHLRYRSHLRGRYGEIHELRNRAFHLEPIWKRPNLVQESRNIWEAVSWAHPRYQHIARLSCRFEETYNDTAKPFRDAIRDALLEVIRQRS